MWAFSLYWIGTSVIGIASFLAFVGVAFAPFAAYISWNTARHNGFQPVHCAIAGAVHSIFFLFPWFYHLQRIGNGQIPSSGIVLLGYTVNYAAWLFGPISLTFFYMSAEQELVPEVSTAIMCILWAVTLCIQLVKYVSSQLSADKSSWEHKEKVRLALKVHIAPSDPIRQRLSNQNARLRDFFPDPIHSLPIVLAMGCLMVSMYLHFLYYAIN